MTLRRRTLLTAALAGPALVALGVGVALRSARAQGGGQASGQVPGPSSGALPGLADGHEGEVRTFELDWTDRARQRPVPVRLY